MVNTPKYSITVINRKIRFYRSGLKASFVLAAIFGLTIGLQVDALLMVTDERLFTRSPFGPSYFDIVLVACVTLLPVCVLAGGITNYNRAKWVNRRKLAAYSSRY